MTDFLVKSKTDEIEKSWLKFALIGMNITYDYEYLRNKYDINLDP